MGLVLTVEPAEEPITIDEAKDHLRVTESTEDSYILALIQAARVDAEIFTGRAFVTQTWEWTLDYFLTVFCLPKPPLVSINSVKYIDTSGVQQTVAATEYKVDTASRIGRLVEAYGKVWPSTRDEINAVTINYTAGYGAAKDVPPGIKHALKLIIGHYYENREDTTDAPVRELPQASRHLLAPYMVPNF